MWHSMCFKKKQVGAWLSVSKQTDSYAYSCTTLPLCYSIIKHTA